MNIWHSFTYSFYIPKYPVGGLPHDSVVNSLPTMQELQETRIWSLGLEYPLKGKATRFSILAWRIPWTEEPGGLQSMGCPRVGHDWSHLACMHPVGTWRSGTMTASSKPSTYQGLGSRGWWMDRDLLGFPGGSDGKAFACNAGDPDSIPGLGRSPGEGNGSTLQYSGLENFMDGGAW